MSDVVSEKVLAVEGKDEVNFFSAFLDHIEVLNVRVEEVGGKNQFKNKIPALIKSSEFSEMKVLAVVRDADEDANAAFDSTRIVLEREGLKPPEEMNSFSEGDPRVGVFIMPGDFDFGMLEDLCLKTVKNHPAMECVNVWIDCISQLKEKPRNMAKAKAQVFLAAMPEIVSSVGIGAQKGYWNFDSEELEALRSFIGNLR